MTAALHLPDTARDAGLEVEVLDGWETRGWGFSPLGGVAHHTGGARPSPRFLSQGRKDLAGPLCNWSTTPDGRIQIIAAGRANHAGRDWEHNPLARFGALHNRYVYGDEMVHRGDGSPWPRIQLEAAAAMWAAVFRHHGWDADRLCSHAEWAGPRKPDPRGVDMDDFRADVQALIDQEYDMAITIRQAVAAAEADREIRRLYDELLGRDPDPRGYTWATRLYVRVDGVPDDIDADRDARIEAVARHIRASDEFKKRHR